MINSLDPCWVSKLCTRSWRPHDEKSTHEKNKDKEESVRRSKCCSRTKQILGMRRVQITNKVSKVGDILALSKIDPRAQ